MLPFYAALPRPNAIIRRIAPIIKTTSKKAFEDMVQEDAETGDALITPFVPVLTVFPPVKSEVIVEPNPLIAFCSAVNCEFSALHAALLPADFALPLPDPPPAGEPAPPLPDAFACGGCVVLPQVRGEHTVPLHAPQLQAISPCVAALPSE